MKSKDIMISRKFENGYDLISIGLVCLAFLLSMFNNNPLVILLSILIGFLITNSRLMFPSFKDENWRWIIGIVLILISFTIMIFLPPENHNFDILLTRNFQFSFVCLIIGGSLIISSSINSFLVFILNNLNIKKHYR